MANYNAKYLTNYFSVTDEIKSIDARSKAVKLAADMLNNPNFTTELDY